MAQCKVWLENYHTGQYFPGSQIQGKVVLNFTSETKCRSVKLRLFGLEHTEWMGTEEYTEQGSNERKTRDIRIEGNNEIFATELILYGAQTGTTTLSAGQHIYPFNVTLPNEIPGSYNCEYGSITFKLLGIVDRPMAFDYTDELIFIVVSLVDLNNLRKPDLLESTSYSDDKTVCCLCCAQGPIEMDITLPKRTLVPEETVNVLVRLSNLSNTNIEGVELKLKQSIVCKAYNPSESRSIENTLLHLTEVGLGAHGENTYTFPVKLPPNCTIPNFAFCKLFKVNYHYKVTALLPGVHANLEIDMYPELGNIEIGHQAPIGGFQPPPVTTYPMAQPSYPTSYPATQYPQAGIGNQQYPEGGGISNYPPAVQPFGAPPPGMYPPTGGYAGSSYPPPVSTPSLTGYPSKAEEAAGFPSAPPPAQAGQMPPPSYDSIQK
ncbi:unnamed protein product [Psylliodes chrysocephalus]|uniref:Arrestin C-terminal-like domain-containing protein n=1 Tax=Psylliodes chrysocephalus TaxID=3402493 RepID=A0A9P0CZ55_9CUCU|nr:unnamed protein product [Psylliodes chrysocephala]